VLAAGAAPTATGSGDGDVVKFFHGSSGRGGLVTPPSPRTLGADSDRQRGRCGSRGGSGEGEVETIDRGAESESSTMSTHSPSLG
jgi:hypothetical protein